MSFADNLHKYPFLRFLLPLIAGIFICDSFLNDAGREVYLFAGIALLPVLVCACICYYKVGYCGRWWRGACLGVLFFIAGIVLTMEAQLSTDYRWKRETVTYWAVVREKPQEKAKTMLCKVRVIALADTAGKRPVRRNVLLYLEKDSLSRQVKIGDGLLLHARIYAPRNNGNPEEFDYARYLKHQQISGTAYLASGYWQQAGHDAGAIRQKALAFREKILQRYKKLGFSGDEYAVLAALTLGAKGDLSKEIREDYSLAGVSHVLALSGLHIGFIYLLISFFLGLILRKGLAGVWKQLILIACLWAFAFLSGLSPSVVRSVIMFSLVAVSYLFNARPVILNTLAATAFFMLLYHPFYLFDVGFQLSFLAVASIVLLKPYLDKQLPSGKRLVKYFRDLFTLSCAAQLGTAPLAIYYFSNFSFVFWLANLIVIPLVSLILYVAICLLCLSFSPSLQQAAVSVLHFLLGSLNGFVAWLGQIPYTSFTSLYWHRADVAVFYFLLLLLVAGRGLKSHRRQVLLLASFAFAIVYHAVGYVSMDRTPAILFYNTRNCPAVHFVGQGSDSYLLAACKDSALQKMEYAAGGFLRKRRLSAPRLLVADDEVGGNGFHLRDGIVRYGNQTVCMLKDDYWKNKKADRPLLIDYLYLCDGYKGKISPLMNLFTVRNVVLDSSLGEYRLRALKEECARLGLNSVSLSDKGALKVNIMLPLQ